MGLGLAGAKDFTLRAQEAVQACRSVFAEFYTSHLVGATQSQLERQLGVRIQQLSREDVEGDARRVLDEAKRHPVAFLTAGDPMTATTHLDLRLRAEAEGIRTRVVHGVSIQVAAPGACGLQSYKFGRTTTLPFPTEKYFPESPYDVVRDNRLRGLHTLVLLDLDASRNRYMTASQGLDVLLALEDRRREGIVPRDALVVALARVGADDERVVAGPAERVRGADLGPPLHCLIVPGELHFAEREYLDRLGAATQAR